MKRLISKIIRYLFSFFTKRFSYKFCSENPILYKSDRIYIYESDGTSWLISFICPCGCKEIIYLNLLADAKPKWSYKIANGSINITPSIWRTKGCKSHFFIKKGKVKWV